VVVINIAEDSPLRAARRVIGALRLTGIYGIAGRVFSLRRGRRHLYGAAGGSDNTASFELILCVSRFIN
jgi:hypothetical protein